jgi:hypothetical protein
VHVDRHPLALGEQVGNADWRDGDRGGGVHGVPTAAVVVDAELSDVLDGSIHMTCQP